MPLSPMGEFETAPLTSRGQSPQAVYGWAESPRLDGSPRAGAKGTNKRLGPPGPLSPWGLGPVSPWESELQAVSPGVRAVPRYRPERVAL